jgi:uncharacterized protein (TIGR01777 family)
MKVIVAGGTGFLGGALCWTWAEEGDEVRVLTRSLPPGRAQHEPGTGKPGITRVGWDPSTGASAIAHEIDGADVVINLSGASVAGRRWNAARKQILRDSRIVPTRTIAGAIRDVPTPPRTFINGSAIGYYGTRGSEVLTEDSAPGDDFLARLCIDWEREVTEAARPDVRTVLLRTGIVIEKTGGALPQMMTPFRLFAGGRLGSGRQYMSWIHRHDWVEMVRWILDTPGVRGPVNATAPYPVTNAEFAHTLGHALHRPALIPTPVFALRLALGEFADSVLASERVIPQRAQSAGYHFRYPELQFAFRDILGSGL